LESAGWGTWAITDKGRQRLKLENQAPASGRAAVPDIGPECADLTEPAEAASGPLTSDLEELAEDYSKTFQRKILQNLLDRTPGEFERFASRLLTAYGFQKMTVTNEHTAPDGGIDGNGEYKVGLVSLRVAFQCKRWRGKVGRPEIDKFRGAISGQYEHGYFFTTSQFSPEARLASIKGGAVPIFLFDGDEIVRIMIDKELGITRRPVQIYEDRVDSLFEKE
jgi:restriction system protein